MLVERDTIKCEAIFDDTHMHRFLWKKVWSREKPLAAVIMLNPCLSDNIIADTTTNLVVNNIARLERFGGVVILNLYSKLTAKLNFRWNSEEDLNDPDNDVYIQKAANECQTVIIAWGRAVEISRRASARANQVLALLQPHAEKLFCICDGSREGLHPLTPSVRTTWRLVPFVLPQNLSASTDI